MRVKHAEGKDDSVNRLLMGLKGFVTNLPNAKAAREKTVQRVVFGWGHARRPGFGNEKPEKS
jgi:hypothetical protein